MRRVLSDIDAHIQRTGLTSEVLDPEPLSTPDAQRSPQALDLKRRGITSIVWATGFRRAYSWLQVPVLDAQGEITHHRGVTQMPGLYVLGQRFQHHRNSNFIDGVGRDAAFVADHLAGREARTRP
jgi:putative flavoprotein involved in K+ transport